MTKAEVVKNFQRNYKTKTAIANRWKERLLRLAFYDNITIGYLMDNRITTQYMLYGCNSFAKMIVGDSVRRTGLCIGVIDRNAENIETSFPIYTIDEIPDSILEKTECVVICLTQRNSELEEEVQRKTGKNTIWLEDILYEL